MALKETPLEDTDFYEYAAYHNISDFSDLSIAEIIALEFLMRYAEPVVRHTLYTEVKQFIEFKEKIPGARIQTDGSRTAKKFQETVEQENKYYSSSFYNSLGNLEEKGLLKIGNNQKGKKTKIEPTEFTPYIPKLLLKFLINNNIMDSQEYRDEFYETFIQFLKKIRNKNRENGKDFDKVLSLWFSEYEVLSIVQQLVKFANKVYIISKNFPNEKKAKAKLKNVKYTEMIDRQISMPQNKFDGVIVPVYKQNPKFFGLTRMDILNEIKRVSKPDAPIVLVTVANVPTTDNFFMNELIKLYNMALNNRIFTETELSRDMEEAKLCDIEIHKHKGLLIGIGKNS
ncbi:MAG: hypothetical protein ACOC4M_03485 [Promethearchaeia archaeon]